MTRLEPSDHHPSRKARPCTSPNTFSAGSHRLPSATRTAGRRLSVLRPVLDAVPEQPVAYWVGVQLGASEGTLVCVWAAESSARAAAEVEATTADRSIVHAGACYRLAASFPAVDHAAPPAFLQLTGFAGPRSEVQVHADELSGKRVSAALADLPGLCGAVACYGEQNAHLVVSFADSPDTFAACLSRIMSTQLGPDEDPALLTGPDRVRIAAVVAGSGPIDAVTSAAVGGVR